MSAQDAEPPTGAESCLGLVPHQIRGYLNQFTQVTMGFC